MLSLYNIMKFRSRVQLRIELRRILPKHKINIYQPFMLRLIGTIS